MTLPRHHWRHICRKSQPELGPHDYGLIGIFELYQLHLPFEVVDTVDTKGYDDGYFGKLFNVHTIAHATIDVCLILCFKPPMQSGYAVGGSWMAHDPITTSLFVQLPLPSNCLVQSHHK
jgi:hypothetical protein